MKKFKIGVQLYSIRWQMEENMEDALKKVKEMGYDCVEFAGYFNKPAEEVKEILDKYGLEAISVHQGYGVFLEEGAQAQVDYLKTLGVKYAAVPWIAVENFSDPEKFSKFVSELKTVSKLLKAADIQLLYHNHDFEFGKFDGEYYLDGLYKALSEDELKTEIDTCWVHYAGLNPAEYLKKYAGRAPLVHLKDFDCKNLAAGPVYALVDNKGVAQGESKEDRGFEFRPVGSGRQDIKAIIEAAEVCGTDYLIVEQDAHGDNNPMDDIKSSIDYLKSIGL